jgi:malonate decarboxylase beta subunit
MSDPLEVWAALGVEQPAAIPMLDAAQFVAAAGPHRMGGH